jgi:hypothetical protein
MNPIRWVNTFAISAPAALTAIAIPEMMMTL